MKQEDYENVLIEIVKDGRGFSAIIDLTRMLNNYANNLKTVINEIKFEKGNALKVLNDPRVKQKEKLDTLRYYLEN